MSGSPEKTCCSATGVILAAGEGRRMGVLGSCLPKACLPIGNVPLIGHHLNLLREIGIRHAIIVVGYRRDDVVAAGRALVPADMQLTFVEQNARKGIAHALYEARGFVETPNLVLVLGDTYFVVNEAIQGLRRLTETGADDLIAVLSARRVSDPDMIRRECSIDLDPSGRVIRIVEKPREPFNCWKPCGLYFFTRRIFDAIEVTPPSAIRGEVEITDAIQTLIDAGAVVEHVPSVLWDKNITIPTDLLESNLRWLTDNGQDRLLGDDVHIVPGARLTDVVVGNRVRIDSPVVVERSLLLDDARIAANTPVRDRIVGPGFEIDAT